ncbi:MULTISPECIES: hypothetical protein [Bacillus cereus group]|uniref:hypothetical protein n=1 Tax=Bacillus cereus group TaxID=86661 RepID=UPI001F0AC2B5|nr:hypothetical protein [Bacillus cereus]
MSRMNKQKEYWNGVANEKEFTTPFQLDLFSKYVNKDAILLDYGCGYGRCSELKFRFLGASKS